MLTCTVFLIRIIVLLSGIKWICTLFFSVHDIDAFVNHHIRICCVVVTLPLSLLAITILIKCELFLECLIRYADKLAI